MIRALLLAFLLLTINQASALPRYYTGASDTTLSGYLVFKLISAGSFYKAEKQKVKDFNRYLDSLQRVDPKSLEAQDRIALDVYGELRKHGLLEKPFFHIMVDGTIYTVYTDEAVYSRVSGFKSEALQAEQKRVRVRVTGNLIDTGKLTFMHGKEVGGIEVVDGETSVEK